MDTSVRGFDYGVEHFDENGFAFCSVLSQAEAKKALQQIYQQFGAQQEDTSLSIQGNDRFKVHLFLSKINQIVHHPVLLQAVRQALHTPHVVLWSSDLNLKQPNSRQYFSAHQDATYTGLQPANECITVWVALSDHVGEREGCLSFLKGSHKKGQLPHVEELATANTSSASNDVNMLSRGQRVLYNVQDFSNKDWVSIPLRAGEATLHHFYTIHQSGHNQHPQQPRVGLALRYMSLNVRQTGPVRECITWIDNTTDQDPNINAQKRRKTEKWFDLEPQLDADPSEEEVAAGRRAHKEAMQREASNYFLDSSKVKAYEK